MYLVHIKSLNFISLQNKNKLHSRFFDKINMNFTSPARYRRNYMEGVCSIQNISTLQNNYSCIWGFCFLYQKFFFS